MRSLKSPIKHALSKRKHQDRETAGWVKHSARYKDLCSDHQNPHRARWEIRQNPQKLSGRSSLRDAEAGERNLKGGRTQVAPPFSLEVLGPFACPWCPLSPGWFIMAKALGTCSSSPEGSWAAAFAPQPPGPCNERKSYQSSAPEKRLHSG